MQYLPPKLRLTNRSEQALYSLLASSLLLVLVFLPEYGGSTFLLIVGKLLPDKGGLFACCLFLAGSLLGLLFGCEVRGNKILEKSTDCYKTTRCDNPGVAVFGRYDYLKPSELSDRVISWIASSWVLNYGCAVTNSM